MNPFNQMTMVVIAGTIGFLIVVGIVAMIKPSVRSVNSSLPAEVIEHSKTYMEILGSKPFDPLKAD